MTGGGARLAIFMPSFRGGGAERVMVTLANGFVERRIAVDMVVAQRVGPVAPARAAGVRIFDLGARHVSSAVGALAGYLRRESPAAMLSALPHANVAAIAARALSRQRRTRLVVSEHVTASQSAAHAAPLRARILPYAMRAAYPRADAIVAVSDGVADDLARFIGIDRGRITRIYNPIVQPTASDPADRPAPHPWLASGNPPVVLGAGRLTPQKDFSTLVRAFARVRAARVSRLVILGEGGERDGLRALADELGIGGDVDLPGFASDPFPYMARAAVFVMSSRWEGFGNVLVEAMACGTPVVSTDCPSGPREILEGGLHGRLVPVADADALARAIESQLDHPERATVVERARAFGVERALDGYQRALGL